jgi:TRAP-type C4-dicarboxylate transport system permease small subunit
MVQQGLKIYPIVAEASSPTFGVSMGWLYLSIPVGGLLMGICILENIIKSVVKR